MDSMDGAVPAALPADEQERLARLQALAVLDSAPEPVFDAITRLAADLCGAPIALVSLVDARRQWFKAATGLPGVSETPRDIAFCAHSILGRGVMEVADATNDPRFALNPLVVGAPHIRFYAGAPIVLPGGHAMGTLCVIDHAARQLDPQQRRQLAGLAEVAAQALVAREQTVIALAVKQRHEAEQHERLRVTLHSIGDAVITTDTRGIIDYMNPVAVRLTGWLASEAQGAHIREVFNTIHDTKRTMLPNPVVRCLENDCVIALSEHTLLVSRDGSERDIADSAAPIRAAGGAQLGAVLVFHDVTEQRQRSRDINYRASHDPLTGLFNRSEFEGRLGRLLETSRERQAEHALMFIDLDHFKTVNDTCGHAAGDELLRQLSAVLQQSVRVRDMLARLGGDEFGLIMEHCSLEQAQRHARLLCERINDYRFVHEDRRFRVGCSIGVVPMDGRWSDAESVLAAADAACYTAKQTGRNRVHAWFDSDDVADIQQREAWSLRLVSALENDHFELFAQTMTPLRADDSGTRVEVLLRLRDSDGTLVPPGAFLPEAERFKLAGHIDYWVVDRVLQQLEGRAARQDRIGMVSINLCQESVTDSGFLERLCRRLIAGGESSRHLCFEFAESVALARPEETCRFATEMLKLGVRIALDDFGHGVSPFRHLRDMPVDYLKIGSHFTRHIDTDPICQATLRYMRDVSLALGMQTVAIQVEDAHALDRLRELGIHYAQGFVIDRPVPVAELLP